MNIAENLTVILPTLDRPVLLKRSLDALFAGDVLPAEVLVVDQSQSDTTIQVVSEFKQRGIYISCMSLHPRGLSAARNAAAQVASRPWLVFTDDDCVPDPLWVAAIQQVIESMPALAAVTGRVLALGPEASGRYAVSLRESPMPAEFSSRALPWFIGSGNNFAVKGEWYRAIGGCDERLGTGSPGRAGEDMDLFYRLLRSCGVVRYEPQALVYHERQGKARRLSSRFNYGFGMGAFCGLHLKQADGYASYILARWLGSLGRELAAFLRLNDLFQAQQRSLGLQGTVHGLGYGLGQSGRQGLVKPAGGRP